MPRGNGTGPRGMGSGTGRGAGYCSGAGAPGFASAPGRGGYRQGFGPHAFGGAPGRGFGWGSFNGAGPAGPMNMGPAGNPGGRFDPEMERQELREQARSLQSAIEVITERLSRLENAAGRD